MSKALTLSKSVIKQLHDEYAYDEHFLNIVYPRLRFLNAIKEEMSNELLWTVQYSMTNKMESSVNISLPDKRKKFHFYYAIPLTLRLSIHLYLGDNTFNFFEAHPLLLNHGILKEGEYKVEATLNTLPHLVLSKRSDKYDQSLLSKTEFKSDDLRNSNVYDILKASFQKFNPALMQLIDGSLQL